MTTDSISQKKASTFRMECRVSITIHAAPERVWALLTDAADFPRWNSTVSSIKGSIARGEKLELRVPISDRTFSPKVTELVPAARMVWSDGMAWRRRGAVVLHSPGVRGREGHHDPRLPLRAVHRARGRVREGLTLRHVEVRAGSSSSVT